MKRRVFLSGLMSTAGACLALSVTAGAAKPPSYVSVPLIMSLRDLAGDGILSDGGSYTDGVLNVRAELVANVNGNLVFDTNDAVATDGGRRLFLDFHGQTSVFPSSSAFPVDVFLGTIPVIGQEPADNLQIMSVGQTLQRRARFAWVDGALQYSVRWDGPENGHSFLNVLCNADDGSITAAHCIHWTVKPDGVGGLYSISTKGKQVETFYGNVSMPFEMTLLRK